MSPRLRQAAWFVGLWAGGVAGLAVVGFGLRLVLGWVGLRG